MTPEDHKLEQLRECLGIALDMLEHARKNSEWSAKTIKQLGDQYFRLLDYLKTEGIDIPHIKTV